MRKLFLSLGVIVFCGQFLFARGPDEYVYSSTIITGGLSYQSAIISSRSASIIVDYTVLSTGNVVDTLGIYDCSVTTRDAIASWEGFPTKEYATYPIGVKTTSGTAMAIASGSTVTKVRIRYYRIYQNPNDQ